MAKAPASMTQPITQIRAKRSEISYSDSTPLNFKVPLAFRQEFKTYAAQHNKKLNQLLFEAFAALKARND